MYWKWIGFAGTAALLAACGLAAGLSRAQDQERKHKMPETPLGKIMERVQKHNIALGKLTRTPAVFKKGQKDVEKVAVDLVRLAKESKPFRDAYLKNAKNESQPDKKWDEIMDAFAKTSQDLAHASAKPDASQKEVKDLFQSVKKTCSDCHTVFRVEDEL
jgi:cytochrome c556